MVVIDVGTSLLIASLVANGINMGLILSMKFKLRIFERVVTNCPQYRKIVMEVPINGVQSPYYLPK